jgi:hypothetical protein
VKTLLAISAVILILALLFFRLQSESGLMELGRCKAAVHQAKSWTAESVSQPESPSFTTFTNRTKVSCPDDYESLYRSRSHDDVIREQSTIHTHGVSYVETPDGKWDPSATAGNSQIPMECGKGPALVQQTVFNAIIEVPRRRAGKITRGQLQTIDDAPCREWSVDYGNEWPQTAPYMVCIDTRTHLPRRLTFNSPGATYDFTGWNSTTVDPPSL